MPTIEEIEQIQSKLQPEIKLVGFETKADELVWKFSHTYRPFNCPLEFMVKVVTDKKGKILNVSGY